MSAPRLEALPSWFRDEDMLRRILLMRRDRYPIEAICRACRISRTGFSRIRKVANGRCRHAAERAPAAAFMARFDAYPNASGGTRTAGPLFTEDEGQRVAADIARWKLNGPALGPGEED